MKIPLLLAVFAALCLPAYAQTAAVPASPVTIPARFVPSQTITLNVPKNGGKMQFTIPAQILLPQTGTTAPVTAPVKLGPLTMNFACTAPALVAADGTTTADLQHVSCTAVRQ